MITNKKILDELVALEATKVCSDFLINGLNYWPAIRIRLAFGLIKRRCQNSKSRKAYFNKELLEALKSVESLWLKSKKSKILFVTHNNYKITIEGQIYDRVLEGYKLDCIRSGETYLELNLATGIITCNNKNTGRIQGCLFILKVYCFFLTRLKRKNKHIESSIGCINRYLSKAFPGFKITSIEISQYLIYLKLLTKYFTKLFDKLGVSTIYQATYYDPVGLSINAAASQLNITTYCAQHGGQSRNNPAFGQWTHLPLEGYEMLPDIFLCWDKESAKAIDEWVFTTKHHKTQIRGYRWPELWKEERIKYSGMSNLCRLAAGSFNILYTMQPSVSIHSEMIEKMIKKFPERVNWWFRLHPRQSGSQEELDLQQMYRNSNNIFILEASLEPLPALMVNMDLHLTNFSSCVYEAMLFNVYTIFIHQMGQEYFDEIIQSGKARLCLSHKELENDIHKMLYDKFA